MRTGMSLRAWLAGVLTASALLFGAGIALERGLVGGSPAASETSEGSGEEVEGSEGGSDEGTEAAEGSGEEAEELRPFGLDLESPLFVGAAIFGALALAAGVLLTRSRYLLGLVAAFAVVFLLFDLAEVAFKMQASEVGLAIIAGMLVALHAAAALLAVSLLRASPAVSA